MIERKQLGRVELAINEALRNAYEHGSLGVSNTEKRRLCEEENLEKALRMRELDALAAGKLIHLSLKCDSELFTCTIEDEGGGFDWRDNNVLEPGNLVPTALHGRGLMLMQKVFDTVAFNDKGNKVTLEKRLRP